MNSLSSIVILLQLVLQLLSSPSTASNPATQVLASQAVGLATESLASLEEQSTTVALATTTVLATTTPIQIVINYPTSSPAQSVVYSNPPYIPPAPSNNGTGIGTVDLSSITPYIPPSCTVSGTRVVSADPNQYDTVDFVWTSQGIATGTTGKLNAAYKINGGVPDYDYGLGFDPGVTVNSLNGESTGTAYNAWWRLSFGGVQCFTKVP